MHLGSFLAADLAKSVDRDRLDTAARLQVTTTARRWLVSTTRRRPTNA